MPSSFSQFHTDIVAAIVARVTNWGVIVDPSQYDALAMDIEQVVVNDQASCIAAATADLGITPDPPEGQQ